MARKRTAPRYAGELAQPIYVSDHYQYTGGLGQLTREPDVAAIRNRVKEKILLLFKHYEIDPSDEQSWQKLAMSLAFAHVPGLQLANRPKPGRKPMWKMGLDDELVRDVEDAKLRTGKRTNDILRMLAKNPRGKWKDHTAGNLGARYREARRRQKALVSLSEAWLNDINVVLARPTKMGARSKKSRRK